MGRRGRKRRDGPRERNGKPKRTTKQERVEERVHLARNQPHRKSLKSNDRVSELAESALGRLHLTRVRVDNHAAPLISAAQLAAGETFAAIVGAYRRVLEGPRAVRSSMPDTAGDYAARSEDIAAVRFDCPSEHADPIERAVRIGAASLTVREWPCQRAGEACACRDRRARYDRIYEAIARAGRRALMAVIAVAVRGEEIAPEELVYLKIGLDAAKRDLGLTEGGAQRNV